MLETEINKKQNVFSLDLFSEKRFPTASINIRPVTETSGYSFPIATNIYNIHTYALLLNKRVLPAQGVAEINIT